MKDEVMLRQVTAADAAKVLAYIDKVAGETVYLTFGPGEFGVTLEQEIEFINKTVNQPNSLMVIAEIEDQIVGMLNFSSGARPRIQHVGEFGITVRKDCWGLGIGKKLMEYLLSWCRESARIAKVNLKVRTDNQRAINLYLKLGFKVEGRITREFKIGDVYYDAYLMGIEIEHCS